MSTTEHEPYDDGTTQVKLTLSEDSGSSAGTVLEELRLDQLVDQGLSGEIYRATNLLAGKACAVKLFRPNLEIGRVAWGRYTHRAEQISRLELPNVARFFGHGRTPDGQYYAVFDWVDGQSLRSLLEQHGKLSQRSYLAVLTGIANALATVHEAGLLTWLSTRVT